MLYMKNGLIRGLSLVLSAAAVVTTLTGCKKGASENEQVSIRVGGWPSAETQALEHELWEKYSTEMKEKYPNITIERDDYKYAPDTFLPLAASQQLPDMFAVPFTEPKKLFATGYLADVTDAFTSYGYKDAIADEVLKILGEDGKYYGVPISADVFGMLYNRKLFEQAGLVNPDGTLKYPKNFDELLQTAITVKEKTGKAGFAFTTLDKAAGWLIMSLAWSHGVKFMEQKDGKWTATFDSPEMRSAMQYISDLKWKYNVLPENVMLKADDVQQLVATDQAAMMYYSEFMVNRMVPTYNMSKDNISTSPVPAGSAGAVSLVSGSAWLFANSADENQIDAMFKWLQVMGKGTELDERTVAVTEEKYQANIDSGLVVSPPSFSIFKNPDRVQKEKEIANKYLNVDPVKWGKIFDSTVKLQPEEPVECQQLYAVVASMLQKILTDKNTDISALIKESNASFQKDFLDNVK